jgi:hypothetical protein
LRDDLVGFAIALRIDRRVRFAFSHLAWSDTTKDICLLRAEMSVGFEAPGAKTQGSTLVSMTARMQSL